MKLSPSARRLFAAFAACSLIGTVALAPAATAASKNTKKTTKRVASTTIAPATTAAPKPDKVTVGVDTFASASAVWMALAKGYFKDENIEVNTATFQAGIDAIKAIPSGQVDFAFAVDFGVVTSTSPNLAILGSIASPLPGFQRLVLRQEISGSRDLFGRKMGVIAGTAQDYVTQKWLEKNGLAGNVTMVPLPSMFEILSALKTNQLQGAFLTGTAITEAGKDIALKNIGDDSDVLTFQGIYAITSAKIASGKPDMVKRFLAAMNKGAKDVVANPKEASEITAKAVKGEAAALLPTIINNRYGLGFSKEQLNVLVAMQKYVIEQGKLPADTDITKSFNFAAMKAVVPGKVGV